MPDLSGSRLVDSAISVSQVEMPLAASFHSMPFDVMCLVRAVVQSSPIAIWSGHCNRHHQVAVSD